METHDLTPEYEQMLGLFSKTLQTIKKEFNGFKIAQTTKLNVTLTAYFGSAIEFTDAINILADQEKYTAIPIILRSMQEAYVDFLNLWQDPNYGEILDARFYTEQLKFYKEAKNGENPYLIEFTKDPELDKKILELQTNLDRLKTNGNSPTTKKKSFETAEHSMEYSSVYSVLCAHSHNNLNTLLLRHLHFSENGEMTGFQIFADPDLYQLPQFLDAATGMLLDMIEKLYIKFDVKLPKEIENRKKEFNNFNASWRPNIS